jgi:hypothetical protein
MEDISNSKTKDIIQSWQSSQETLASKYGALPNLKEMPNALALVLNLQHIEVKSTVEKLQNATDEEKKAHKALRTTFVIVKMLFPGFTYIDTDNEKDAKYQKKGATKGSGAPKEKLGHLDDCIDHVILHTYKMESKKGVYRASKRLEECIALSPGMVINGMIWGEKIVKIFKDQSEDIFPFQFGLIQMKLMSNSASSAIESGRMLEIKSFNSLDNTLYSPSSFKLLKAEGLLANSIQAAAVLKEKILDGSFLLSEHTKGNLNQKLVQGSLSNTVQLLALTPQTSHGVFAMGADGKIKLFMHQPIGDVKAYSINTVFDRKAHHCPEDGSNDDWMVKLLNLGVMLGAVQLLVIMDTYKNKDVAEGDMVLEGYARVDVSQMLKKILACKQPSELASEPMDSKKKTIVSIFETQGMANAVKHLFLYPSCGVPELDLLIDTRKLNNKKFDSMVDTPPHSTALVHSDAKWKKGHMLYVFLDGKSVLSAIIPLEEGGSLLFHERAKRGLDSVVQFADQMKDVEFEEEEEPTITTTLMESEPSSSTSAPSSTSGKKKQKTNP